MKKLVILVLMATMIISILGYGREEEKVVNIYTVVGES